MTEPIADGRRPTTMLHRRALAPLLSILLAACAMTGGPDTPVTDTPGNGDPGNGAPGVPAAIARLTIVADPADGPALQVGEALSAGDGPVRVTGSLFIGADGRMLLCSAIAESFPPQCGGDRLEVVGLDLATVPDLQDANGVRWADSVELSGTVD